MKNRAPRIIAVLFLAVAAAAARAADFDPQNWPCVQRLVPEISVAAVWPHPELLPPESERDGWRDDSRIARMARALAAAKGEKIESTAAEFADDDKTGGEEKGRRLALSLVGAVDLLNEKRDRWLRGIFVFAKRQREIAAAIAGDQSLLAKIENGGGGASGVDVDELSERIKWSIRLFDERERRLRFLCERPTFLERQAFFIARALAARVDLR